MIIYIKGLDKTSILREYKKSFFHIHIIPLEVRGQGDLNNDHHLPNLLVD